MGYGNPILILIITVISIFSIPLSVPGDDSETYDPDSIIGIRETERGKHGWSRVEIYREADHYNGRIIWISDSIYPPDDPGGMPGEPVVDRRNPDKSKRNLPVAGMQLMKSFVYDKKNIWKDGRIYDPESGKTYRCKLTMKDENTLEVYGYIKVVLVKFGRNTTWSRYQSKEPHTVAD